jgi:hypothetical protein
MAADGVWKISLTTGSESHMGTTSDVIFYAYGSEGKVGPLTLGTGEERQHFQAGQTDDFVVSNFIECVLILFAYRSCKAWITVLCVICCISAFSTNDHIHADILLTFRCD